MKIVIIGSAHPFRGGLASYNERLAKEFILQGHEVSVYTFTLQYPEILFPGKTQYSDAPKPEDINIVQKINSINPFNWFLVGKEIATLSADLLVIKYWIPFMAPCFGTILRRVKKNKHTRIVSIIDNIIPHEKRIGDNMLTSYFVKPVDAFIAMSKSVLKDLEKFTISDKCYFCPHPLYDNFGTIVNREEALNFLGLDPSWRYMLFFGFIREYKGLDILLKALGNKNIRKCRIKLIVAGEYYTDPSPYKNIIKELGISDIVIEHTDFISDDKVKYYFSACDVVVQPYKDATQSGVTQIAYHFEKPMIVSNVGGLPEMVPHGKVGYVVNPNPEEIANAICEFFERNVPDYFRANIIEEKKKYSWARLTDTIFKAAIGRKQENM